MTRLIILLFLFIVIGFGFLGYRGIEPSPILGLLFALVVLTIVVFGLLAATIYQIGKSDAPKTTYNYYFDTDKAIQTATGNPALPPNPDPDPSLTDRLKRFASGSDVVEGTYRNVPDVPKAALLAGGPNATYTHLGLREPRLIGGYPHPSEEEFRSPSPASEDESPAERYDWNAELPETTPDDHPDTYHNTIRQPSTDVPTDPHQMVVTFLNDYLEAGLLELDVDGRIPASYLHEELFASWQQEHGAPPLSQTMFGRVMGDLENNWPEGWQIWKINGRSRRYYAGLAESEQLTAEISQ